MSTTTTTTATRTEPKTTVEKPRLILTHGEKGGVGKTTVARIIADYLASRDTAYRAFDAEGATGQLLRFHPEETDAVAVESAAAIAPVLDYLMDGNGRRLALVDLGARSGEDVRSWLYRGGALEEAEAARLGITVIYVLGGAVDSVGHLKECFAALGRDVNYVVVKNFGVAGKFDVYDNSKVREELLTAGAREIEIPALDGSVYQSVDRSNLSFTAFADGRAGNFGYTERRYCRIWLRECFVALDTVATVLQ